MRVCVGKVATLGHEDVVTIVDLQHFVGLSEEEIRLEVSIESFQILICYYWITAVPFVIPVKPTDIAIVVEHGIGIDLGTSIEMLVEGLPDELHRFVGESLLFVLEVKAGEEPRIKSHVGKQSRISIGVAEGVHVPTDAWLHSELLQKELVADHHVVDHVLIMSARLIVHTPTRIHELESPLLYQLTYLVLECTSLVLPPHAEELHLDISESLVGISE